MRNSSFGHAIRLASGEERKIGAESRNGCAAPSCEQPPVFIAVYRQTFGPNSRVAYVNMFFCQTHGADFVRKHRLEMPDADRRVVAE